MPALVKKPATTPIPVQLSDTEFRQFILPHLSMLTLVCHLKKVMHRGWAYFQARLAFTMAVFN